jgi:hypothetical protein
MVMIRKWPRDAGSDYADLFALADPKFIAESLKRVAESSHCLPETPYERALAILSNHLVHDGATLSTRQKQIMDKVKDRLRDLFMVRG